MYYLYQFIVDAYSDDEYPVRLLYDTFGSEEQAVSVYGSFTFCPADYIDINSLSGYSYLQVVLNRLLVDENDTSEIFNIETLAAVNLKI